MKQDYLAYLRDGKPLSTRQQISLTLQLSVPAIMAQISSIIMQYIDASMVGRLGSSASASIGLVSSTTWLFGGVCSALVTGFTVQVAQAIGAKRMSLARSIMKLSLLVTLAASLLIGLIGVSISGWLPRFLGGDASLCRDSSSYFLVYSIAIPAMLFNRLAAGMLQASGNMRVPSTLNILMCFLDVVFNMFLIFPSRHYGFLYLPGAGLGVLGAALGTALAQLVTGLLMLYFLLWRSELLALRSEAREYTLAHVKEAMRISSPIALEQIIACGAQVMATRIVAPLGTIAIAANSFSVTAEGLCYMPGYGIGAAASTLIGQSVGSKRKELTNRLGWLTTLLGMAIMTGTGILLYIFAPVMIGFLSPDPEVIRLGTLVLRIEAFAEPMFAASIVASYVFRGAGDTLVPSVLNFSSMWLIRIPMAAFLAPRIGLKGVWIAMCIQLIILGALCLIHLKRGRWMKRIQNP